jgi:hypothetical protein
MSSGKSNKGGALSHGARSLLDAARDADSPTSADRERVKKALAVALATGAVTAGAATATAAGTKAALASGAGGATSVTATGVGAIASAGLLTKVAIVVVAVGVTSGALVATQQLASPTVEETHETSSATAPTRGSTHGSRGVELLIPEDLAAAPEPAPSVEEVALPSEPAVPLAEPVSEPSARRPSVRATPSEEPAAPEPESRVTAELAVLTPTHVGPPAEMLERVVEYDRRFPEGGLMSNARDQMLANAIRTLCAQGPAAVSAYLDAHPGSPHASAIRSRCP